AEVAWLAGGLVERDVDIVPASGFLVGYPDEVGPDGGVRHFVGQRLHGDAQNCRYLIRGVGVQVERCHAGNDLMAVRSPGPGERTIQNQDQRLPPTAS